MGIGLGWKANVHKYILTVFSDLKVKFLQNYTIYVCKVENVQELEFLLNFISQSFKVFVKLNDHNLVSLRTNRYIGNTALMTIDIMYVQHLTGWFRNVIKQ